METGPSSAAPQVVDLGKMSLPRLVFALLHRRFTGTVGLQQQAPEPGARQIWFTGGMPIFTDWASPDDRIGQVLVDLGLIAADERDRAVGELALPGAPRERFGHYLVRKRLLTGGQLRKALKAQCARKLVHVFALRGGSAQVLAGEAAAEGESSLPAQVNALETIHAGVLAHYDLPRIAAEMGLLLDGPLRLRSAVERYRSQFHFSPGDEAIIDALKPGNRYLTDAARLSGQPELQVAQVVYTLWACQMLKSASNPVEHVTGPVPTLPAAEATGPTTLPPGRAARTSGADFVGELERLEAAIAGNANAFDLLGVSPSADRSQIRAAWHVLSRRFHPDGLPHQGLGHLRERSQAVFAGLSEAYQRLSDPEQREQIAALLRGAPVAARPGAGPAGPTAQAVLESEMIVREGDKLLRAGSFDRALERYRKAAALTPDELEVRAAIAWCEFQLAPDRAAVRDTTRAALFDVLARQPRCVRAHYDLGLLSLGTGEYDQAQTHFTQVLELDPDNLDAKRQVHALQLRRSTPDSGRRKLFGPRE